MSLLTDLAIQAIAGAVGGHAAGGLLKNIDLGPIAKTVGGAVGGGSAANSCKR